MWAVNGIDIKMVEGDFGISLPITIGGVTFDSHDEVKLTIKDGVNGNTVVEKVFNSINENTVNFILNEGESALLPVGSYVYAIDWYKDGSFMCNIVTYASFKVVEKA